MKHFGKAKKIKLSQVETGRRVRVTGVYDEDITGMKLSSVGLVRGTHLTVLRKKRDGGAVILLRGTRFALGRGAAEVIGVEYVGGE